MKDAIAGFNAPNVRVPNGVVLLHQPPISEKVPMISSFALKLETYLRMANIPYENSFVPKNSSKGKIPWIEYSGKKIPDSNFCISFLNEEFNVTLDDKLSKKEKAISHAIKTMVEENTYWTMVYYRWIDNTQETTKLFFPKVSPRKRNFVFSFLQKGIKQQLVSHGMGRHSKAEVYSIARKDLQTLSDYLEAKSFIMGEEPTVVDASVFGYLAQVVYQDEPSPQHAMAHSEFKNLVRYCDRMRERYWLDWDEAIAERKKFHSES